MIHELAIAECYAVYNSLYLADPFSTTYKLDGWERGRLSEQLKRGEFVAVGYHGMFAKLLICRPEDLALAKPCVAFNPKYSLPNA